MWFDPPEFYVRSALYLLSRQREVMAECHEMVGKVDIRERLCV